MKHTIETMYLDYVNSFLTVSCFAEYYGITTKRAYHIIETGRDIAEAKLNQRKV